MNTTDTLSHKKFTFHSSLTNDEKREYDELLILLASEKSTRNHLIKRGAELERELDDMKSQRADFGALVDKLERELNAAKELIREIRDNEVNAVDEATKFLRDYPINEHNK